MLERQKLVYPKNIDQDVISLFQDGVAVVNLFQIRMGKLIQKENFVLENAKGETSRAPPNNLTRTQAKQTFTLVLFRKPSDL